MRLAIILAAVALVLAIMPGTSCDKLTREQCQRAEMIDAGAID